MQLIDDNIPWEQYVAEEEGHKVKPASAYMQSVIDSLCGEAGTGRRAGYRLPWNNFEWFELRDGEMTGWAGVNGHGKSALVSQIMLQAMRYGAKVFIASMEMKPVDTLERMLKQAASTATPSLQYARQFSNWTDGKLWLYDHQGPVTPEKILAICRYVREKCGADQIVIDSLMKCKVGTGAKSDAILYNAQSDFISDAHRFAQNSGTHLHLVMHMRKGERESAMPDKFDVKGASEITDQIDNLAIIGRNKRKEDEADRQRAGGKVDEAILAQPDSFLAIRKQRHAKARGEGTVGLWYRPETFQFHGHRGAPSAVDLNGPGIEF